MMEKGGGGKKREKKRAEVNAESSAVSLRGERVVECALWWGMRSCSAAVFFMSEQIGPIVEIREGIKSEGRFHTHLSTLSGNSLHAVKLRARALCSPGPVSSQFYCDTFPAL